jgi:hypothetical protein
VPTASSQHLRSASGGRPSAAPRHARTTIRTRRRTRRSAAISVTPTRRTGLRARPARKYARARQPILLPIERRAALAMTVATVTMAPLVVTPAGPSAFAQEAPPTSIEVTPGLDTLTPSNPGAVVTPDSVPPTVPPTPPSLADAPADAPADVPADLVAETTPVVADPALDERGSALPEPIDSGGTGDLAAATAPDTWDAEAAFAATELDASATRDPWMRPFRSTSIWNMPIGSGAQYAPAGLPIVSTVAPDWTHLVRVPAGSPQRPIMRPGSWTNRCSGNLRNPFGAADDTLPIPDSFIVPDAAPPITPNNIATFLLPDGRSLVNMGGLARCTPGGPVYGYMSSNPQVDYGDLYGDGTYGGHGASFLSNLGGAIRPGELSNDEPIRHALDIVTWGRFLYRGAAPSGCRTWPAIACDIYWQDPSRGYLGTNSNLRMGSLLAIPPGVTAEQLGLTTRTGRKVFQALQDYGGYVTEDSYWNAHYLTVDKAAQGTFTWGAAETSELNRIMAALHVVTNNGPSSVGGGGVPRRPLLPELGGAAPAAPAAAPVAPATTVPARPATTPAPAPAVTPAALPTSPLTSQAISCNPNSGGYTLLGRDGRTFPFGGAPQLTQGRLITGYVDVDSHRCGFWLVDERGVVEPFGDARAYSVAPLLDRNERVVSISHTPSGQGYWLFTSRGRVLPYGDAGALGGVDNMRLVAPIIDSVATPSGLGYWMVAGDGGVFAFGDARFYGSMGGRRLNQPVRSLVPTPSGRGYWLVAADGGVFAFGDALFRGSMGSVRLNQPVVGMVSFGSGYLLVGGDGGVFNFSDRPFSGSLGAAPPNTPIVSLAAHG